jgi:hypothetical protein
MPLVVAIDSFDSPNESAVRVRRQVVHRTVPYVNPSMTPRHRDERHGLTRTELNGNTEANQLLLLGVSPLPQPGPVVDPGGALTASATSARLDGHSKRAASVAGRGPVPILNKTRVRKRPTFANSRCDTLYTNGNKPRRVRLDVGDHFKGTRNPRWIWCPSGVLLADVGEPSDEHHGYAIGCTCRDMMLRGVVEARFGCKHIVAFNAAYHGQ